MIGAALGTVALFGAAVSAAAQTETGTTTKRIPLVAGGKSLDADTARNCVSIGYVEGIKRGQSAGKNKSKYNAKSWMPYRNTQVESPFIPSDKYRPFYDEGYTRGYEDGYNSTTKYGTMTEQGGQTKYTIHQDVLDALVGPAPTGI